MNGTDQERGIRAGIVAYLIWGLLTIYWKRLADFDPIELIGWRVATATVVMIVVVTARRSWPAIRSTLSTRSSLLWTIAAAVLLTGNWGAYVYAVVNERVLETALGYFMAPLGTMAIGILLLGERPTRAQKASMVLAAAAVVELTVSYGRVPVAALVIAVSWTFYGLCKRRVPLSGVDSFAAETFVLIVPAVVAITVLAGRSDSIPQSGSGGELTLVALSGIATAIPLSLFAFAAVRVPFTILGPIQFLVPIINLLLGWLVYDEQMPASRLVGFGLVWLALMLVTVDRIRVSSAARLATP